MNPLVRIVYIAAAVAITWFALYWYQPQSGGTPVWINAVVYIVCGWLVFVCLLTALSGSWTFWRRPPD